MSDGSDLRISVGWGMSEATSSTAKTNPGVDFALVDYFWDVYLDNLRGITLAEDEAGYLAGTLTGLMTQADVVGPVRRNVCPRSSTLCGGVSQRGPVRER
ncbi:MAG: BMP family ABC transporter substrate-binding protein [Ardenticatenia bacterium]|nr:BMP family ABC transporter substrate-binding protein [Ardenticatenia bacterium]